MLAFLIKISPLCFAASYAVAFGLELWRLFRPRPILRIFSLGFAAAGLLAQTAFLLLQSIPLASATGSLFFLALILAVFCLYGSIHHRKIAFALFVLPVVLGLIGLGKLLQESESSAAPAAGWSKFWGYAHGTLLLLAAVGVCVAFISSVMYLVQLRRLRAKLPPNRGMPLFSLERLELMNRRAILAAFPLLTAGLLAGFVLQVRDGVFLQGWDSPKILSVAGLWLVFTILLYLRYWVHVRGRQMALLTMVAFAVLVFALIAPHSPDAGVPP